MSILDILTRQLHDGKHSCVVENNGETRMGSRRGVADIHDWLVNDANFLRGASVADKVVGKAAAALMILGGVKQLYADVISQQALCLFKASNVEVHFGEAVEMIVNRAGTDFCPLEKLTKDESNPALILPIIEKFINSMSKK